MLAGRQAQPPRCGHYIVATCALSRQEQVDPPGQGPGSEASTFRENTDTQFWRTSAITSSHFVSTYCKRCSVPFNVEGNEAENDAVCPSPPYGRCAKTWRVQDCPRGAFVCLIGPNVDSPLWDCPAFGATTIASRDWSDYAPLGTRGPASASCFCVSHHRGQGSAQ